MVKIGIDISQLAHPNTGVANYLSSIVREMVKNEEVEFVLFYSSMRRSIKYYVSSIKYKNVTVKAFKIPPTLLDLLWNKLHIIPIERFIGDVDFFISSDWTEPPTKKAKKATILYDLLVYKFPEEMHKRIRVTQKRKLEWVKKESSVIFCISEATKEDAHELLEIPENKLQVIYPGI